MIILPYHQQFTVQSAKIVIFYNVLHPSQKNQREKQTNKIENKFPSLEYRIKDLGNFGASFQM